MTTEVQGYRDGAINSGLTTGIIGTSLGALNLLNNGGVGGLFGLGGPRQPAPEFITRNEYEAGLQLAAKDSAIATLKAERDDEKKMVEVYAELERRINRVNDKIDANKEDVVNRIDLTSETLRTRIDANKEQTDGRLAHAIEKVNCKIDHNKEVQDGVNALQLSYNAGNTATINCLQGQVAQLYTMTKLGIKNSSLCPGVPEVVITHPTLSATP